MLFHLLYPLSEQFPAFNVFRYITFRTASAVVTSLLLSMLLGPAFIRLLRRLSVGQNIRDVGPDRHQVKAGTPTMGGLLILFAVIIPTLLWANLLNPYVWLAVGVTVAFGAIGFTDDFLKIRRHQNLGLTARSKMLLSIAVAVIAGVILLSLEGAYRFEPAIYFPFFKRAVLNLGILYLPFLALILVGSSHAVNLTDGLDGLAIGPVIIAAGTYLLFAYVAGHATLSNYLQITGVTGAGELSVLCGSMIGAGLGFLWFNTYPAQIFMGDIGALAVGAALGLIAVIVRQELVFIVMAGVFVMETVSVILQVASFKLTGRRIFRMAPVHHHFELKGWPEPRVIVRFWIISVILVLAGLATLIIR